MRCISVTWPVSIIRKSLGSSIVVSRFLLHYIKVISVGNNIVITSAEPVGRKSSKNNQFFQLSKPYLYGKLRTRAVVFSRTTIYVFIFYIFISYSKYTYIIQYYVPAVQYTVICITHQKKS